MVLCKQPVFASTSFETSSVNASLEGAKWIFDVNSGSENKLELTGLTYRNDPAECGVVVTMAV